VVGNLGCQNPQALGGCAMIRIAISEAAYAAITETLPLGSVGV
jgi:hypothetical protein